MAIFVLTITTSLMALPAQAVPSITVKPTSGPPGTPVTVTGSGFVPSQTQPCRIEFEVTPGEPTSRVKVADCDVPQGGEFKETFSVPGNAKVGSSPERVWVCNFCGGDVEETAFTAFNVTASPSPSPSPTGTAPPPPPPSPAPSPVQTIGPGLEPQPPTFEPTVEPVLPSPDCEGLTAPEEVTVTFEEEASTIFNSLPIQFTPTGALTPVEPEVDPRSPSHALTHDFGDNEFGSFDIPIRIRSRSDAYDFVRVFVGLEEAPFARRPFRAILTAFGLRTVKGVEQRYEVGTDTVFLEASPQAVTRCLAVSAPGQIFEATIEYDAYEPELIDDLTFGGRGLELPPDDRAPVVEITTPEEGVSIGDTRITVRGTVREDRALITTGRISLDDDDEGPIGFARLDDSNYFFATNLSTEGMARGSEHTIEVRARDLAGNSGTAEVNFIFEPPATLDLVLRGMEVTQGIQCFNGTMQATVERFCRDNSVELVAERPTLVRLYVRLLPGVEEREETFPNVSGRVCRSEGECVDSINRIAPEDTEDPVGDHRPDLSKTLNFLLPASWVAGETLQLLPEVNPDGRDGDEATFDNNRYVGPAYFRLTRKTVNVVVARVRSSRSFTAAGSDRWQMLNDFRALFPASRINLYMPEGDSPIDSQYDYADTRGDGCGEGWNGLLDDLWWFNFWTDDPVDWLRYYGMVTESQRHDFHGCGYRPGDESGGMVNNASAHHTSLAGDIMAQEIGHNHGRRHAPGCGAARPDSTYPAGTDDAGDEGLGIIGEWGVDLRTMTLKPPTSTYDFMGYCGGNGTTWVGPYTWSTMFYAVSRVAEREGLELATQIRPQVVGEEYLVGSLNIDGNRATLRKGFFRTPLPPDAHPPPSGRQRFRIELRDASGQVLEAQAFDIRETGDADHSESGLAQVIVRWRDGTASVAISKGADVIYRQAVSPGPPTVEILSPNGGEEWPSEGPQTIRWEATDPDDDVLTYTVHYSTDGGSTWRELATGLHETTFEVRSEDLAGGEDARIRVAATDGINTAFDTSDASFTVPAKPPQLAIASPVDGHRYRFGGEVILDGMAADFEDQELEDDAYAWESDRDGPLGSGPTVWNLTLRDGRHVITLAVTDSDGLEGTASVEIFVGERPFPTRQIVASTLVILLLVALMIWFRHYRRRPQRPQSPPA